VSLAYEDTCMVDTLGQSKLENLRLQSALQKVLQAQAEHIIELHLGLVKHANTYETAQKSIAC